MRREIEKRTSPFTNEKNFSKNGIIVLRGLLRQNSQKKVII